MIASNFFQNQRNLSDFHIKFKEVDFWEWVLNNYDNFLKKKLKKKIIPKKIHQIWIGKEVPKKYKKWRVSWMKNHPEYEYFLWDETKILKLDLINRNQFKRAINPAVKSDIARYEILYKFGGIYVDTDFESLKKIDDHFLTYSFIVGQLFDYKPLVNNGIMFASKKSKVLEIIIRGIKEYPRTLDYSEILSYCGPYYITDIIKKNRNKLKNILILPSQYFYPWPNFLLDRRNDCYNFVSKNSYAIHHWEMSWHRIRDKIYAKLKLFTNKILRL